MMSTISMTTLVDCGIFIGKWMGFGNFSTGSLSAGFTSGMKERSADG